MSTAPLAEGPTDYGEFCELTHFLPLPPKLEVRK